MLVHHLLGHAGAEPSPRTVVVFLTQHDEIHIQLFGPLQDDLRDIVLRRADDLSVGIDTGRSQMIHRSLDDLSIPVLDVVLR